MFPINYIELFLLLSFVMKLPRTCNIIMYMSGLLHMHVHTYVVVLLIVDLILIHGSYRDGDCNF